MGRPRKPPGERKATVITIPVTAEQKRLIVEAGDASNPSGYTPWARDVLLTAAEKAVAKRQREK